MRYTKLSSPRLGSRGVLSDAWEALRDVPFIVVLLPAVVPLSANVGLVTAEVGLGTGAPETLPARRLR
eukprot:scaffold37599_cov290-Amphora_coffeaeformis.AAC.2